MGAQVVSLNKSTKALGDTVSNNIAETTKVVGQVFTVFRKLTYNGEQALQSITIFAPKCCNLHNELNI